MYGREELVTYISCEIYNKKTREFHSGEVLLKDEADKVMDAMEARIKELEEDIQSVEKNTDYLADRFHHRKETRYWTTVIVLANKEK